jgi:hypothetical protein
MPGVETQRAEHLGGCVGVGRRDAHAGGAGRAEFVEGALSHESARAHHCGVRAHLFDLGEQMA